LNIHYTKRIPYSFGWVEIKKVCIQEIGRFLWKKKGSDLAVIGIKGLGAFSLYSMIPAQKKKKKF
jgi:hypothetical protein